jgi:hypothetical protein
VDNSRRCLQTVFQFRVGLELAVIFGNLFCNLGGLGAALGVGVGRGCVFAHSGGGPAKHLPVLYFPCDVVGASERAKVDQTASGHNPPIGSDFYSMTIICSVLNHVDFSKLNLQPNELQPLFMGAWNRTQNLHVRGQISFPAWHDLIRVINLKRADHAIPVGRGFQRGHCLCQQTAFAV